MKVIYCKHLKRILVFEFKSEKYSFCYITTKITIRKLTIIDGKKTKKKILKNPQNLFLFQCMKFSTLCHM